MLKRLVVLLLTIGLLVGTPVSVKLASTPHLKATQYAARVDKTGDPGMDAGGPSIT